MLNKIFIMGRLTRDPELRRTQSGTPVTSFSLAVDRDYKTQSGEVVADNVYFGDSRRDSDGSSGGNYANNSYGGNNGGYSAPAGGYAAPVGGSGFSEIDEEDGDLPF